MSGPAYPTMAPFPQPSTPLRAAFRGSQRPALTAAVRGAFENSGRGGETAFSQTKKLSAGTKGEAIEVFRAG